MSPLSQRGLPLVRVMEVGVVAAGCTVALHALYSPEEPLAAAAGHQTADLLCIRMKAAAAPSNLRRTENVHVQDGALAALALEREERSHCFRRVIAVGNAHRRRVVRLYSTAEAMRLFSNSLIVIRVESWLGVPAMEEEHGSDVGYTAPPTSVDQRLGEQRHPRSGRMSLVNMKRCQAQALGVEADGQLQAEMSLAAMGVAIRAARGWSLSRTFSIRDEIPRLRKRCLTRENREDSLLRAIGTVTCALRAPDKELSRPS